MVREISMAETRDHIEAIEEDGKFEGLGVHRA